MARLFSTYLLLPALLWVPATASSPPKKGSLGAQISRILEKEISVEGPGIAISVVRQKNILFRGAKGLASIELRSAMRPESVFRIGSITKTITAATVLNLVANHQLSLDDRLSRFYPDFPNAGDISISQLLEHTSGISDNWEANPMEKMDTTKLLRHLQSQPLDFKPGTEWRYSNSGYMMLGAVIEILTKKPWNVEFQEKTLGPLGLSNTYFAPDSQIISNRADGYSEDEAGITVRAPYTSMSGPGAAGALSSTIDDISKFIQSIMDGAFLPTHFRKLMISERRTLSGQSFPYGYGVMTGDLLGAQVIEHNGGIEGFASHWMYLPEQKVTIVVLTNSDAGFVNPRSLAHRIGAMVLDRPYPVFEKVEVSIGELGELSGVYQVDSSTTRTLIVKNGRLYSRKNQGPERPLIVAKGDVLLFRGDGIDRFKVRRGAGGTVSGLDYFPNGVGPARIESRIASGH